MNRVVDTLKHEFRQMIPVTLFFFLTFQLLALTQVLMLRQYGISTSTFLTAAVGALVVGKVVLIADHLPFVNRFPHKPLIYNVVWKTAIYFTASLLVRYGEHIVEFWENGSFVTAHRALMANIVWPHFWAVQLWLLVLLLTYCTGREIIRALGQERVLRLLFTHPANQID